jgi:soluble P-type ATPase
MKISFDYDGTLTQYKVQLIALDRVRRGDDVYIISARSRSGPLFRIAESIGIPKENVFATGSNLKKIDKIKELGIEIHFDDNPTVIKFLEGIGRQI